MQIVEGGAPPQPAAAEGGEAVAATGDGATRPASRRRAATSVDDLEAQFQRRKKKELEQARLAGAGNGSTPQQVVRAQAKLGRNDPCYCGSGKKFKKCHGTTA
jgi:preprotein translocase subunit SecA